MDTLSKILPLASFDGLQITKPGLFRVPIDHQTASEMLVFNIKNRWVRKGAVDYLTEQIKRGEWREDHPQPIVFSNHGRLIDGQHRLLAIVKAGLIDPVIVRVETGAHDQVREYLDTGVPRSLDDRVELVEDTRWNKLICQLAAFDVSWINRTSRSHKSSPENTREFFEFHKEALLFVCETSKPERGVGHTAVAYAAMEYFEISSEKCEKFYPALFHPDSDVQQSRMLRDFLLRAKRSQRASENIGCYRLQLYKKCVGAMRAHLENRKIKQIKASSW